MIILFFFLLHNIVLTSSVHIVKMELYSSHGISRNCQPHVSPLASLYGCSGEFKRISQSKREDRRSVFAIKLKFYIVIQLAIRYECISPNVTAYLASLLNSWSKIVTRERSPSVAFSTFCASL